MRARETGERAIESESDIERDVSIGCELYRLLVSLSGNILLPWPCSRLDCMLILGEREISPGTYTGKHIYNFIYISYIIHILQRASTPAVC